jgi:hypothetical protein
MRMIVGLRRVVGKVDAQLQSLSRAAVLPPYCTFYGRNQFTHNGRSREHMTHYKLGLSEGVRHQYPKTYSS